MGGEFDDIAGSLVLPISGILDRKACICVSFFMEST